MKKLVVGLGFWVQGLRCLPWMAVNFFLKDGLGVEEPSILQLLHNWANLPMLAMPFYGLLSDSLYVFGQHRIPYIALGALLQAVSWLAIAFHSPSTISLFTLTLYLLLGNLGASIAEVAIDAIVAETAKQPSTFHLQSFAWTVASLGAVMGNLLCGRLSPQAIFFLFGTLLTIQFFITISTPETSLDLPKKTSTNIGIRKQFSELVAALRKPEICQSMAWLAASYAMTPAMTATIFYYQTQQLHIESYVLGISKVVGQTAMLLWGVAYNRYLKSIPPRKLIWGIQVTTSVFMISDVLFVKGVYRKMGVPDSVYVAVFSGFVEALGLFKVLPFSVVMAQLSPQGCEGSLMAFLMSAIALGIMVSGYLGVALAAYVGNDFSGLAGGLMIQAASTLLPLYWSSSIPDPAHARMKTKMKEN